MNKTLLTFILLLIMHFTVNAQKNIFSTYLKHSVKDSTKTITIRKTIIIDSVDTFYKNYKQIQLYTHFNKPRLIKQLNAHQLLYKDIIITQNRDTLNCNIVRQKKNSTLYKSKHNHNLQEISNADIDYYQYNFYNTILNKTPDLIVTKNNDSINAKIINNHKYYIKYQINETSITQENTLGKYDIVSVKKNFFIKNFHSDTETFNKLNICFNIGNSFSNFNSIYNFSVINIPKNNKIQHRNGISHDFEATYLLNKTLGVGLKANTISYKINYIANNNSEYPFKNNLDLFLISPYISFNKNIQNLSYAINLGTGYFNFKNVHQQEGENIDIKNHNFEAFYKFIINYKMNSNWSISLHSQYIQAFLKQTQSTDNTYNIPKNFDLFNFSAGMTYHLF